MCIRDRVEDSFTIDDSGNTDNSNQGNTDVDVEVEDSFTIDDSGNTDNSVEIEESFNPETDIEESFNPELDVEVEDSYNATEGGPGNLTVEDPAGA